MKKNKSHKNHEGEWVAVSGKKILLCDKDPGRLVEMVKEQFNDRETVIMRVSGKNQLLLL